MGDLLYRLIRWIGRPARYRISGLESYTGGPALFVANHLGSAGPLRMFFSIPVRFYPWVVRDMLERRTAHGYLYADFVEPEMKLRGWVGRALAWVIAQIAVPLLNSTGCIPVDKGEMWSTAAFRCSAQVLAADGVLLILPEDPDKPAEEETGMRPFQHGFVGVCRRYYEETGKRLPIFTAGVIPRERLICLDGPLYYGERGHNREAVRAFCEALEERVRSLITTPWAHHAPTGK